MVVVAYSGGYVPAAWALHKGGTSSRVIGVLMLDALYGEAYKYADWIERHPNAFFVSSYTSSSARGNQALRTLLAEREIAASGCAARPAQRGRRVPADGVRRHHESFVTQAWAENPIKDVLERMRRLRAHAAQAHRELLPRSSGRSDPRVALVLEPIAVADAERVEALVLGGRRGVGDVLEEQRDAVVRIEAVADLDAVVEQHPAAELLGLRIAA